jgi:hypothetical protein
MRVAGPTRRMFVAAGGSGSRHGAACERSGFWLYPERRTRKRGRRTHGDDHNPCTDLRRQVRRRRQGACDCQSGECKHTYHCRRLSAGWNHSPGRGPGIIDLAPLGHDSRFAGQLLAELPESFVGVLDLSSSAPFAIMTLRALTNTRGDFLLTTFPVAEVNCLPPR